MNLTLTKQVIVLSLGLLLAACASIESKDTGKYIFLNEWDLLFIDVKYSGSLTYDAEMPDRVDYMDEYRRQDVLQMIEELLFEYQLPIKTYILEEEEEPIYGPILEIFAMRLEQDSSGDFVATIRARLRKRGELNTLGTYNQRETLPLGGGSHSADKAYRDVIRKPLKKMLDDLNRHFPTPEEKEILDASLNAPAAN